MLIDLSGIDEEKRPRWRVNDMWWWKKRLIDDHLFNRAFPIDSFSFYWRFLYLMEICIIYKWRQERPRPMLISKFATPVLEFLFTKLNSTSFQCFISNIGHSFNCTTFNHFGVVKDNTLLFYSGKLLLLLVGRCPLLVFKCVCPGHMHTKV